MFFHIMGSQFLIIRSMHPRCFVQRVSLDRPAENWHTSYFELPAQVADSPYKKTVQMANWKEKQHTQDRSNAISLEFFALKLFTLM